MIQHEQSISKVSSLNGNRFTMKNEMSAWGSGDVSKPRLRELFYTKSDCRNEFEYKDTRLSGTEFSFRLQTI